jgi:AraC family transcriptional regulator
MNIKVVHFPGTEMAGLQHKGPHDGVGEAWQRLLPVAESAGLFQPGKRTISLFCQSPDDTPESEYESYAGVEFAEDAALPAEMKVKGIPAGDYAMYIHSGAYRGLGIAWQALVNGAEPVTGRKPAKRDRFEIYLNNPLSTPEADLRTEIYLPLD